MSPSVHCSPGRVIGSRHPAGRRPAVALLAALAVAGCSSGKKPESGPPPVEQLPPPIRAGSGTPTSAATPATIGAAGGTLESPDGRFVLSVPPGAVAAGTEFTVQPVTSTAPGGVGGAFRVRPEGVQLAKPVTLVLKGPDAYHAGISIESLGISYQDATGFWYPVEGVTRDAVKNTLTTTTTHFSDWGVQVSAGYYGLYGTFTLDQQVGLPFTATGRALLFYLGTNTTESLYIQTGDLTVMSVAAPVGMVCPPTGPPPTSMAPAVAELRSSPQDFRWSINGPEQACTDSGGVNTTGFISSIFDSMGLNLIGCTRPAASNTLTVTPDPDHPGSPRQIVGAYRFVCASGTVSATLNLSACVPGVQCEDPTFPCTWGAINCSTGQPVCEDTGAPKSIGVSCGTNLVCDGAGACASCIQGDPCTTNPSQACVAGKHDCTQGPLACVDGLPKSSGTNCGSNLVCDGAGACASCIQGDPCTTNPNAACVAGKHECTQGPLACVDGLPKASGTACGSNLVCDGAGACAGCVQGEPCTTNPSQACVAGQHDCTQGPLVCVDGLPKGAGTACGSNLVCDGAGACAGCVQGDPCATNPNAACVAGRHDCTQGPLVCVDGLPKGAGTGCGSNLVCDGAGFCTGCVQGDPCVTNPGQACVAGKHDCTQGPLVCVDGLPKSSGTSCGSGLVCDGAGFCTGCVQGDPCTTNPNSACVAGKHDCTQGPLVCVDGLPKSSGTTCGSNLVCDGAGACAGCIQGDPCTTNPNSACVAGKHECTQGPLACVDGLPKSAGTGCGTNLVCDGAGACAGCVQGDPCTTNPSQACVAGKHECTQGPLACVDGLPKSAGTGCGTNLVCDGAGVCAGCVQGDPCTTNPSQACVAGKHECTQGPLACVDGLPKSAGTGCGTNLVCDGAGVCAGCVQGDPCTTNPNQACVAGKHECTQGPLACVDGLPKSAGTNCGTNLVCDGAGACAGCVQGDPCTTNPNSACLAGKHDCTQGPLACVDGLPKANGTSCGAGQTCSAGACVASRTVSGTRLLTMWPDPPASAASGPAPDVLTATVAALVPDGQGGWLTYPGAFDAAGNYTIPAVPLGGYLLAFRDGAGQQWYVQTSVDTVDLGYDLVGRATPPLIAASGATPVTLDLGAGGLDPWDPALDQLQLTSSNADLWDALSGAAFGSGATSGAAVDDWFASAAALVPLNLLDVTDPITVHQLHAASAISSTADATAYPYFTVTRATAVPGQTLVDRAAATITVPLLAAPATSGSLAVDWSLSAFEALLPAMVPGTPSGTTQHALRVGASAHPLALPAPRSLAAAAPMLLELTASAPAQAAIAFDLPLGYGQPLAPPLWNEWRETSLTAHVDVTSPGATVPIRFDVTLGERVAMLPAPATPIAPVLSPVQGLLLGGSPATVARTGVGLVPVLAWSAPATGVASSYAVDLFRLEAAGPSSVATRVATLVTSGTSLQLPAGVLSPGQTYLAYVTARAIAGDAAAAAPLRASNAYAWASAVTSTFAP